MKKELSFLLTILLWIYQVSTDNHFSVGTTCTQPSNLRNEIEINCTVCGFSDLDFLNFEVEWLLQKDLSITSPAKITPGNVADMSLIYNKNKSNYSKYTWKFITVNDNDCEGNKTVFKLIDQEPNPTSFGIYTCYVTLNGNITKQSSVDLSYGQENTSSNYVRMRVSNVPVADIAKSCRKYGYNVFMDDSVAKSVPLRKIESAYFPVCPRIQINNQSISVCKPWISRQGCYNLKTDNISEEMDCRSINIANWNKSLPLIGMKNVGSCYLLDGDVRNSHPKVPDEYCLTDKDFNNFQVNNKAVFLTLYSIINIDTKHTEEINSECVATYVDLEPSGSTLYEIPCHKRCDAYCTLHDWSNITYLRQNKKWEDARKECNKLNKSLPNENFPFSDPTQFKMNSTVCLDVFKNSSVLFQPVVKLASKENGGIIINASTNHSMSLQYLCGTKIAEDLRLPIIITCSVVGILLIVMILACFITRVLKRKGNQEKSSTTGEIVISDLYSEPIPASGENKKKTKDHISAEDESAYSVADTNDNEYSQPLVNRDNRTGQVRSANDVTISDSEYADTDLGEYDVLRGQRKKQSENTSSNCDIYDRTNNVVTGIYDVTSNTLNENEYSMTDNDSNQ